MKLNKNFRKISPKVLLRTATIVSLFPMFVSAADNTDTTQGENSNIGNEEKYIAEDEIKTVDSLKVELKEEKSPSEKKTFFSGSSLSGGLFLFGRNRDRLDATTPDSVWNANLDHISTMASMKFTSPEYGNIFGFEFGGFMVYDIMNGEPSGVNQENEFSFAGEKWSENYADGRPRNGFSVTQANAHFALPFGLTITGGLGQFGIEGVIGQNWSYMPGTHAGGKATWNIGDKVSLSYALIKKYKAPWFRKVSNFSKVNAWDAGVWNEENLIDYIQGGSIKFKINDNHSLTASVGNSEGYMMNYFGKYAGHFDVADGFDLSYQLYISDIIDDNLGKEYEGYAQYHVLTTNLNAKLWNFKLEGTHTIAEGTLGNYLPRLTRGYANSQGGFQVWWDMRSDWNENGETAFYLNVNRKLDDLFKVPGWKLGAGGAYGFGATYKPSNLENGKEAAWKVDLSYTTDIGRFKGATFAIHYMQYTNMQSELGDWAFPNMFSSERDLMVKAILPFGVKF